MNGRDAADALVAETIRQNGGLDPSDYGPENPMPGSEASMIPQVENNTIAAPLTCGTCAHWRKGPANALNLADVKGECKEGPPHVFLAPGPQGPMLVTQFPILPPNFLACGRHKEK